MGQKSNQMSKDIKQRNSQNNSMPSEEKHSPETNGQGLSPRNQDVDNPKNEGFSQKLLNIGFGFALLMSVGCLIGSVWYLFKFSIENTNPINNIIEQIMKKEIPEKTIELVITSRVAITRLLFSSCGMVIGMSFGFLGFALFLIGIKGEMNIDASSKSFTVTFARMSPGIFVIFCAAILIGICVTKQIPFSYKSETEKGKQKITSTPPSTLLPPIGDDFKP